MIKSMFGVLALFIFLMAPVSGQVDIDAGLTPSEAATDVAQSWESAVLLLDYLVQSDGANSCVQSLFDSERHAPESWLCVFQDPLQDRVIFFAGILGRYNHDRIFLLRDGELFAVAASDDDSPDTWMVVSDLPSGEYEVLFIADSEQTAAYFWLDRGEEG